MSKRSKTLPAFGCGFAPLWFSRLCDKGRAARCAACSLWLAIAWAALPAPARADMLVVTNGQRFVGTVVQVTKDSVVFESEPGGRLTFTRAQVREIQFTPPAAPPGPSPGLEHPAPSTNQLPTINSQLSTNAWLPPSLGHDDLDWIQLKSGSWISGRFRFLQYRKLEFDNDELDEQTFKFKDIRQIYPSRPMWARFDSRQEPAFGTIVLSNGVVSVNGPEQFNLPRDQLIGLTPAGIRGMPKWSGNLTVGLSLQSGNNDMTTLTTGGELARRTPTTDLVLDYLGNYSQANGVQNANNQRVDLIYDIRLDRHWFVRPAGLEYYYDPVANISLQGTAMTGGGYYIFDRSGLMWNVAAGPGYQYTRFDTVEPGQADTATTPAGLLYSKFKVDITQRLDFSINYRAAFISDEAGQYAHHTVSTLSFKIKRHLNLDVSFVWDFTRIPQMESSGEEPKKSDYYLTVGLGARF